MLKRTAAWIVAGAAALAATGTLVAVEFKEKEGVHPGEILGVDRDAKTVTIRVAKIDDKETHVFHVTGKTVIKDKATGKILSLADLASGDKVIVKGGHREGKRVALEILVRPDKERGKDKS